jgi:hypothetical protein
VGPEMVQSIWREALASQMQLSIIAFLMFF